jgi:DNA-binding NtrC family response regulator
MPNKDGFEVIGIMHKLNPKLPIIVMSAGRRVASGNSDSFEIEGVKGVLHKPFTHNQMLDLIEMALN